MDVETSAPIRNRLVDGFHPEVTRPAIEVGEIARLEAHPTPPDAPDLPSYRARGAPPPPGESDQSAGIDTTRIPR